VRQTFELKLNSLKNEFNQNLEDIKLQENQRKSYNDQVHDMINQIKKPKSFLKIDEDEPLRVRTPKIDKIL
jgi:hypothetical protein